MRKEVLFAVMAGAFFGLIIAFGVWRANGAFKPSSGSLVPQASTTPTPNSEFGITIAKPEDQTVVSTSPILLSGLTMPNSLVAISGQDTDYVIKSGKNGSFEQQVALSSGLNEIVITVFSEQGESVQKRVLVVYSSEFEK